MKEKDPLLCESQEGVTRRDRYQETVSRMDCLTMDGNGSPLYLYACESSERSGLWPRLRSCDCKPTPRYRICKSTDTGAHARPDDVEQQHVDVRTKVEQRPILPLSGQP